MRPTVHGHQIVMSKEGKCAGVNIGYNFYCEHEGGTDDIIKHNWNIEYHIMLANCQYNIPIPEEEKAKRSKELQDMYKKRKKLVKQAQKLAGRWKATPYKGYTLPSFMEYGVKSVIVDNTPIKDKYRTFQLANGEYIVLVVGWSNYDMHVRYGRKRKLTEEDLLYMPDYQSMFNNTGYQLRGSLDTIRPDMVYGAWSSNDGNIMVIVPKIGKNIIDDLIEALKGGSLACTPFLEGMYSDRGCCLTCLDTAYFGSRT